MIKLLLIIIRIIRMDRELTWLLFPDLTEKYGALMGVTKGFDTFMCRRGWGICCFLLHQFCPWGGGSVRFWHSWTSEDWGDWVVSTCFLIPKGGFKMDNIKVLCWFIFFPIKLRAQELFINHQMIVIMTSHASVDSLIWRRIWSGVTGRLQLFKC